MNAPTMGGRTKRFSTLGSTTQLKNRSIQIKGGIGDGLTYRTNYVSTTKYTILTLIPRNLFEQFHRIANIWFLIVSVFQILISELSPTSSWATIVPLTFVLTVTLIKDAIVDYRRYVSDKIVNNRITHKYDYENEQNMPVRWEELEVGNIVFIQCNEFVPADLIVLDTSDKEEHVCYIETSGLDGETNLKLKAPLEETTSKRNDEKKYTKSAKLEELTYDRPNKSLYKFQGLLKIVKDPAKKVLDNSNILLRGSSLRNTRWIYGLVIYTGYETKLMQNSKKTPAKRSFIEILVNRYLFMVFALLFLLAGFSTIASIIVESNQQDEIESYAGTSRYNSSFNFITFLILMNGLVPISLYVTMDLVKVCQAKFIEWDETMYHEPSNTHAIAKTADLNEELGYIEYVFTDKTGTITENSMEFRMCSIDGMMFGKPLMDDQDDVLKGENGYGVIETITDEKLAFLGRQNGTSNGVLGSKYETGLTVQEDIRLSQNPTIRSVGKTRSNSQVDGERPEGEQRRVTAKKDTTMSQMMQTDRIEKALEEYAAREHRPNQDFNLATEDDEQIRTLPHDSIVTKSDHKGNNGMGINRDETIQFQYDSHPRCKFHDSRLTELLEAGGPVSARIRSFFTALALCHTVIPDKLTSTENQWQYQAQSPDEEALVIAARCMGFKFVNSNKKDKILQIGETVSRYTILGVNEFNSDRKRMSVVLRPPNYVAGDGGILICKGADSHMLDLINEHDSNLEVLEDHLYTYSTQGLRTLVVGMRNLTEEECDSYIEKYNAAKSALVDRDSKLDQVAREFEDKIELLGATAIEDKIQKFVPQTISLLLKSNIRVWMLTGDKQETAINIGYSCKLLTPEMNLLVVNVKNKQDANHLLTKFLRQVVMRDRDNEKMLRRDDTWRGEQPSIQMNGPVGLSQGPVAMVVDGFSLEPILSDEELAKLFVLLSIRCSSIIACRVSPLQKSQLVKLVKDNYANNPLTLAIGDGANDVSMIQEAHVGIGISGKEGMQAVNASDYAIAQFSYLQRLLLVHGRWNYRRISKVILYSFYKNFVLILPMFLFNFYNGFSGTALYDSWLIMSFNIIFTALPILFVGIMDRDLTPEIILRNPCLYVDGQRKESFNAKTFFGWMVLAIGHSLIIFFVLVFTFNGMIGVDGRTAGSHVAMGTLAFFVVISAVAIKVTLLANSITMPYLVVLVGSILIFIPYLAIYSETGFPSENLVGVFEAVFSELAMYLAYLLPIAMTFMVDYVIKIGTHILFPNSVDRLNRRIKNGEKPELDENVIPVTDINPSANRFVGTIDHIYRSNDVNPINEINREELDPEGLEFRPYYLTFYDNLLEREYQTSQIRGSLAYTRVVFIIITALVIAWTVYEWIFEDPEILYAFVKAFFIVASVAFCIFSFSKSFMKNYHTSMLLAMAAALIGNSLYTIVFEKDGSVTTALTPVMTFVLFNISTYKLFILNVIHLIVYLLRVSFFYADHHEYTSDEILYILINYYVMLSGITFFSAFVGYQLERGRRTLYVLNRRMEGDFEKNQDILANLLPEFVKDRIKKGERSIAEDMGHVTIIFCDICQFHKITTTEKPHDLIEMLDKLFGQFDELCSNYGIQKIETVGKTYMACGGLKASEVGIDPRLLEQNPAKRCLHMALDMMDVVKGKTLVSGELKIRIGIHTGTVIAGVVGAHKPQFSLIGDTVNTSSRMCSTGADAKLHISSDVHKLVGTVDPKEITFIDRGDIPVKGKGHMHTYFVERPSFTTRRRGGRDRTVRHGTIKSDTLKLQALALGKNESETPKFLPRTNTRTLLDGDRSEETKRDDWEGAATSSVQRDDGLSSDQDRAKLLTRRFTTAVKNPDKVKKNPGYSNPNKRAPTIHPDKSKTVGKFGIEVLQESAVAQKFTDPRNWTFRCETSELEIEYRHATLRGSERKILIGFGLTAIIYLILTLLIFIDTPKENESDIEILYTLRFGFVFITAITVASAPARVYLRPVFPYIVIIIYSFGFLGTSYTLFIFKNNLRTVATLEALFLFAIINHSGSLFFKHIIACCFFNYGVWVICVALDNIMTFEIVFFTAVYLLMNFLGAFIREAADRRAYLLTLKIEEENKKTDELLKNLLPPVVIDMLKDGQLAAACYKEITMLYADIVGFTKFSAACQRRNEPQTVVEMLSKLFTKFDNQCKQFGVYKVHTIGDCYVVMGYKGDVDDSQRNIVTEVMHVIKMAFSMISHIHKVAAENEDLSEINMRIGIHTGEVITGIIGTEIVRYDVYGKDAIIANEMESSGKPGFVNISETTKAILEKNYPGFFNYNHHKLVECLGEELDSYLISPTELYSGSPE